MWQVIEFIEDNAELFDSQIVNVNNLKPMTTSAFVHIMSVLFQIVLPRRKIAMDNYKEVIPLQLKMLNFPGQISNNTIKAGQFCAHGLILILYSRQFQSTQCTRSHKSFRWCRGW